MNGLECLHEEMKARGCTSAQINTKAVSVVLDILSEDPGKTFSLVADARKELEKLKSKAELKKHELDVLQWNAEQTREKFEREFKDKQAYIDKFYAALESCETPEGRDRLRAAQVYANSAILETKYDNTVYNNWLGALLAGASSFDGLEEIRKVNPEIDTPKVRLTNAKRRF